MTPLCSMLFVYEQRNVYIFMHIIRKKKLWKKHYKQTKHTYGLHSRCWLLYIISIKQRSYYNAGTKHRVLLHQNRYIFTLRASWIG